METDTSHGNEILEPTHLQRFTSRRMLPVYMATGCGMFTVDATVNATIAELLCIFILLSSLNNYLLFVIVLFM